MDSPDGMTDDVVEREGGGGGRKMKFSYTQTQKRMYDVPFLHYAKLFVYL